MILPLHRSRTLVLAALALIGGIGIAVLACHRAPAADRSMFRLSIPGTSLAARAGETRPATRLFAGHTFQWTIPAGPARHLRFAYAPGGVLSAGIRLKATVSVRGTFSGRRIARGDWSLAGSGDREAWRFADLTIPAVGREASVEVAAPSAGDVVLGEPALVEASEPGRLLLLVDVDTLRRDHVSIYGYGRRTTPAIDRFFATAMIFERCLANSNWTLPSHATMFTSTLPGEHGTGTRNGRLPMALPTLAEALSRGGWRTIAVTNGGYVDASFGFARGFDSYLSMEGNAREEVGRALAEIDRHRGENVFVFLHTYQVHNYAATATSAEELFGSTSPLGPQWDRNVSEVIASASSHPAGKGWLTNRYDAALRGVDDAFGVLLAGLEGRSLISRTGVVLTSDHGEEIFDRPALAPSSDRHGLLGHTHPYLYDEYFAVPLLVRLPRRPGPARLSGLTSLVDLAPTLLDAAAVSPPPTFRGRSLLRSSPARKAEFVIAEAARYDSLAVWSGARKMIRHPGFELRSWEFGNRFGRLPVEQCFELGSDSREDRPAPCGEIDPTGELAERLESYVADSFPGSLVLRVPPSAGSPMSYSVRAWGKAGPPEALSFGVTPDSRFRILADAREGRFGVEGGPAWVAFRPRRPADSLEVELHGAGAVAVAARVIRSPGADLRWADLLRRRWDHFGPLPEFFSTPPGSLFSSPGGPIPIDVVARLRSLGYLAGPSSETQEEARDVRTTTRNLPAQGVRLRPLAGGP